MLQNEYLLAKIGADTEENEPSKVWSFPVPNRYQDPDARTGINQGGRRRPRPLAHPAAGEAGGAAARQRQG